MHLHGPLAMSNIADLLVSSAVDIGKHSWEVVIGHVLEGKLPELFVFVRVIPAMVSRVLITSTVTHPHIIPAICQHQSGGLILVVY